MDLDRLAVRGACIRLYTTGPVLHVNHAHVALGVERVEVGPEGWLWVHHPPGWPVVAILPIPDETLSGRGIILGASGGTNYSRVKFTHVTAGGAIELDLRSPADYAKVAGPASNLWFLVVGHAPDRPSKADRALAELARLRDRLNALDPTVIRLGFSRVGCGVYG